jgi:UDP-N-acetyl-D-glucosamine dehydrogenase
MTTAVSRADGAAPSEQVSGRPYGGATEGFVHDVGIVGLGYVGLPTALAFHAAGRDVLGLDIDTRRLAAIESDRVDLLADDHARLSTATGDPRFTLTADPGELATARALVICVPTPVDEYLVPDLRGVRAACASAVAAAVPGQLLLLTSTTYVGCTVDLLVGPLTERGLVVGEDVHVAFSPERIDPGNDRHAHEDVPRVVGGFTPACTERATELLSSYARAVHPVSSPEAAEMTKLLENTFRAVNIAMINEFAEAARSLRLDVTEVIGAAGTKPYGYMPFLPGPGVGGHCIPCDPHYLLWQLRRGRVATPVIEQAMESIAARPRRVVERAREVLSQAGKPLAGSRVLVLGMTYKPDVEDLRESPALEVADGLLAGGADVAYHDPFAPTVVLPSGATLTHTSQPRPEEVDLVLVHTLHRRTPTELLTEPELVLDATYRLELQPNTVRL